MSLPVFSSPRELCIYLEKHDYNIGSKNFIRAVQNKNAGLLLEELVTRLCRSRKIRDKSVSKIDGKAWLEINDHSFKKDCFLTPAEVRNARQHLLNRGFIEVQETSDSFRYSINGNSLIDALNKTKRIVSPLLPPSKITSPDFSLDNTSSNFNHNLPPIVPPPRASRISENFSPTFEMKSWAKRRNPELDLDDITEAFIDYWRAVPGARGMKLDWNATWRNWIRNTWPKGGNGFHDGGKTRQPKNGWFTGDDVGFIN